MQIFRHHYELPPAARGSVVAIGNFDGVHRGHRIVLDEARAIAGPLGARLAVMSFEPHPRSFFRPDDPPFRLSPFRIRARLLDELGVDLHFVLPFDEAFSKQPAEDFITEVLVKGLGVQHVVVGYDFCFGRKRAGNADMLLAFGRQHDFGVTAVAKATAPSGLIFSSSTIRDHLRAGRPRDAAALLGRDWEIEGRVEAGDRRGRTLGYPTANIELGEYLRPAFGVYAVRAAIDTGHGPLAWHDGVANIGIRPMYESPRPLLEVFLFDFSGDLYGKYLRVALVEYLRGEARFDTVEALIAQMDRDCSDARAALERHPVQTTGTDL
ncbi:MAG: bifunctional riboflavin kinase/FAD synthetase [Alphaproteobacteria bacterium]|jgi:riboflavin kinase/FMN adenylyltransferase|nr:bifunctional riboflavin kinase/FAD synthetase [Alphaproteobacteria bacterium]